MEKKREKWEAKRVAKQVATQPPDPDPLSAEFRELFG
jgi:hypothetical protein